MKKFLLILFFGALIYVGYAQSKSWDLNGNAGTTKSDFLGTTDCMSLIFKTNAIERMRLVLDKSSLGIGIPTSNATLHLHLQEDSNPCVLSGLGVPPGGSVVTGRNLLQITTPETGSNGNNGFNILSLATKEIFFSNRSRQTFLLKYPEED